MTERLTKQATLRFAIALTAGCGLLVALASCMPSRHAVNLAKPPPNSEAMELVAAGRYVQCVPYARDRSGVQIYGDAWTWWAKADGRYDRGLQPRHGAVLTLKKTDRLRSGHVAVVVAVVEPRKILVDHANWGSDASTKSKIHVRQPVIDVSPNNDWSAVRFMNTQGGFGAIYAAHGFIYGESEIRTAQN